MLKHFCLVLVERFSLHDILAGQNHKWQPHNFNMELSNVETEFTSLFSGFIFQKRTNSMWGSKNKEMRFNEKLNFEKEWVKTFQSMQEHQLKNMECDYIIYHPLKKTEAIFKKLAFLSDEESCESNNTKKRQAEFPTCSISVKRAKKEEKLELYLTKTMWNTMIQQIATPVGAEDNKII